MSNALTTIDLDAIAPQIAALLPPDVSPDRFREVALAAIRQKPDLLKCDRQSLFNAIINAAQDGLLPDGREGAIVPRKGKAVWQPMVLGIYKRVKSSGSVATLSANLVYDGETFDVLLGDDDRIVHRRDMSRVADGSEVAVYAIATLKDGTKEREVMTWEQVERVRQSSATPNEGPWVTWPGEMARKTVVRRLAKRLPVLDPADERLHSAIGRVDSLYNFGTPAQEAPPPTLPAAAASTSRGERKVDPTPYEAPPKPHPMMPSGPVDPNPVDASTAAEKPLPDYTDAQWDAWIAKLRNACGVMQHRQELVEIADPKRMVGKALKEGPDWVKRDISEILSKNFKRFVEAPEEPEGELPEVEIEGERNVMAG